LSVFSGFRRHLVALQALTEALQELATIQRNLGPALDRLEVLERERHHFEAECAGMLLKAEGKFKAATSAEQRERQLKKANARLADPFGEDGETGPESATVQPDYAPAGEAERMQAMRLDVAPSPKQLAQRAKFGVR